MNTKDKGDIFELEVLELLKEEVASGRMSLIPNNVRIYNNKGYYSRDREKNIIVDISIEVWPPNSENYSVLIVIECKALSRCVPVDDLEEFKAKLDQIGGKNIKGIVITKNSFQSGSETYAKNQGIGLARVMPNNQVSWLMHMASSILMKPEEIKLQDVSDALANESYHAKDCDFFSVYESNYFVSLPDLFNDVLSK